MDNYFCFNTMPDRSDRLKLVADLKEELKSAVKSSKEWIVNFYAPLIMLSFNPL